jgi:hypothetical protein
MTPLLDIILEVVVQVLTSASACYNRWPGRWSSQRTEGYLGAVQLPRACCKLTARHRPSSRQAH